MSEPPESTHTPLLNNPWFYGSILVVGGVLLLFGSLSPQIRNPWFLEQDNRRHNADPITRKELLQRLEKHPEDKGIGHPGAPVVVTEFLDFQCTDCRQYALEVFPLVLRNFVETGKVYYRVRHFPRNESNSLAFPTALASECAGEQNGFWTFKRLTLNNQKRLSVDLLNRIGGRLNNHDRYIQCLEDGSVKSRVNDDIEIGNEAGISELPAFMVNDQLLEGTQTYDALSRTINEKRQKTSNTE